MDTDDGPVKDAVHTAGVPFTSVCTVMRPFDNVPCKDTPSCGDNPTRAQT
jgi:hypothetical protein